MLVFSMKKYLENVGKPYNQSKGFEYGTHEVVIGEATATTKKTQKMDDAPIISVVVFDEVDNEKSATCTLYFHTEGGAKMSVTKVLGILIHNVGEDKKDNVRALGKQLFGSAKTPLESRDIAIKLINDKLVGKKAYLVSEPSGKYDTTAYGDLWHYPAEPQNRLHDLSGDIDKAPTADIDASELPDFGV